MALKWGVVLYTGKYVAKTHCGLSPLIRVSRTMCRVSAVGLVILFSFKVVDKRLYGIHILYVSPLIDDKR